MAAKTMVLNLYGDVGTAIEKMLNERISRWLVEQEEANKSILASVKDGEIRRFNKEAWEEARQARQQKLRELKDNRPTRVAIVYELLEKGIAQEKKNNETKKHKKA